MATEQKRVLPKPNVSEPSRFLTRHETMSEEEINHNLGELIKASRDGKLREKMMEMFPDKMKDENLSGSQSTSDQTDQQDT